MGVRIVLAPPNDKFRQFLREVFDGKKEFFMMLNFEDYVLEYEHQTGIKLDLVLMKEIIQELTLEKIKLKIRRDFKDHELKHLIELLYLIENTEIDDSDEPKIIN